MMKKDCTNCTFEYLCDWKKAKGEPYCEDWRSDLETERNRWEENENGERNMR